jgi:hypothetical protein
MANNQFNVKTGKRGHALVHSGNIVMVGMSDADEKSVKLVAAEHGNLPAWAEGSPHKFWQMADITERENGAVYREFEVELPTELTADQNLELVKDFVRQELPGKTYQFAIHAPAGPAVASGDSPKPHFHLMFSDRLPDGLERKSTQHFRRFNPEHPTLGGCKKDSGGKSRMTLNDEFVTTRKHWAALHNEHLARHGHATRIDAGTILEPGKADEPEQPVGHVAIKVMTDDEKPVVNVKRKKGEQPVSK